MNTPPPQPDRAETLGNIGKFQSYKVTPVKFEIFRKVCPLDALQLSETSTGENFVLKFWPCSQWSLTAEYPGRQVPGRVERSPTVEAEAGAEPEDGDGHAGRQPQAAQAGLVCEAAGDEDQEGGGDQLVGRPRQPRGVGGGEGGEDVGGARDGPVEPLVVFVPHQALPVGGQHQAGTQESPQVLSQEVVRNLPPLDLPHHGQGHRHCRVQMAPRHPHTEQQ